MTPQLQKPAPDFAGTAVINGQFKEIKLSDFKGKYLVKQLEHENLSILCNTLLYLGSFLLSARFVSIRLL